MYTNAEQLQKVKRIDEHVNRFPDSENGNAQLLTTIYDHMESFKYVMDSATKIEMNYLLQQYHGFYRLAKLLELMAQGISDGTINAPKDH